MRIDWKGVIIPRVKEMVSGYSYRPTLRQIFYRLVAALLISNTEPTYKSLSRATVDAREMGIIDPLAFQDRVRKGEKGIALDQLRQWPDQYTRPLWTTQQMMPIIWLEKDALFTPVTEIAGRYRVKVYAARGYSSFIYEAAQDILAVNKPVKVLQLTDFDPSGEDMVRDLIDRLIRYGAGDIEVAKIALTANQVSSLGLPPMPAKKSDPRYETFVSSHGDQAVELDALPPDELEVIISRAIEELIDAATWNAEIERSNREREEVKRRVEDMLTKLI